MENDSLKKNGFKIRPNDVEDKQFSTVMNRYYSYLKNIENKIPKELIKYFGWDFFHDGLISNINLSNDLRNITMLLSCPNIKYYKNNKEYEYVNCTFQCKFANVVYFNMLSFTADENNDPILTDNQNIEFMYSEINSLTEFILRFNDLYKEDELSFNSLIIDTMPSNRYIEIVFSDLEVTPVEELSFHQILNDERYFVPFYGNKEP